MGATQTIRPASREEWLEIRKGGIGSSEVASVLGLNKWQTPLQLWRLKLGIDEPKEENFFMKAGHYLEDAVSRFYADETGREIIKRSSTDWIIRDTERPWLQVSPDRTYWIDPEGKRNDANKGILECKTTQMAVDGEDIPMHWFCQVQYQLAVAQVRQGSIAWLTQGREFGYKTIERDDDFCRYMIERVDEFWRKNIQERIEPEAICPEDVLAKFDSHVDGKYAEGDERVFGAYVELKQLRQEMADLKAKSDECEDVLKLAIGDAEGVTYRGEKLATWKYPKARKAVDTDRLIAEHPNLASQYECEKQGSRRFLVK